MLRMKLIALAALGVIGLGGTAVAQVANGKVTSAAPTYVDGTANGLSLDTSGNLRTTSSAASSSVKVNCNYNVTLPTYTNGQITDCQADINGQITVSPFLRRITGGDAFSNSFMGAPGDLGQTAHATNSGLLTIGAGYYFNGTSWDRQRGDTNGTFAQGNVASGAADAGSPVKIGCVFNTTAPTVTTGQRVDCQTDARGSVRTVLAAPSSAANIASIGSPQADALSNNTTMLGVASVPYVFNGTTWDRQFTCPNSAVVNVTAGTTAQIVPLVAAQTIRVCTFAVTASANGTFQFVTGTGVNCGTGTTNLTGAMAIAANDNNELSSGNGSLFRSLSANALCLAAVGGNMTGFISFAQY